MPIISLSILSMVKGALFLSKSAAVKTMLMKHGAYIVGKLGVDGTLAAAATASVVTGAALSIASIPQNTKDGFNKIISGLENQSAADFFEGLFKISQAYSTVSEFQSDFFKYVDTFDISPDVKVELKEIAEDMKSLFVYEIEKKSIEMLKEFEDSLSKKRILKETYLSELDKIYHMHTDTIVNDYYLILGRGGRIYADICSLNIKYNLSDGSVYDHYLVYCIAGWILEHVRNIDCLIGVSQKQLAHDITDNILDYLRYTGKN
ncbi:MULTISPECIES: hypothetical protein [Bacteroidales]|jgi:hypothetical protein|uniref:Uncharacterized protein n=3 Tax=Bacteroidales TaxID=171549 RepID=A0ABX2ASK0_9BACT|nr:MULTISPECIES: hypothetical protein [Bacteroidales]NPE11231.1 hypothetical protein [Prevotella sp. PJ1A]NPE13380.1 hypothetical protein [Xylanibacter rodentium]NPE39148.1 hypothetical protein [Prevotella sp. PCJ2]